MISGTDICVELGRKTILDGVNFQAQAGQLTAIVGPNGSGKTTLLRALTGEQSYRGEITFGGKPLDRLSPLDLAARRAVLPQAANIAFPFTVLELVRLGLVAGLNGDTPEERDRRPAQALARVGLEGYGGRLVQELSGGERQRAQLARVLVQIWEPVFEGQPRFLFLDEPVSALDIGHQLMIMHLARDYAEAGGGVIAIMHDLNLTSMFADQVTLLGDGHVRASGTPEDVLTDHALSTCYGCPLRTNTAPTTGRPWILPQAALRAGHG
ncbi:heme ABC transporter ATP-binding protein [Celeribacter sp.]|uniref:heme ABC transporter ATP-binding protein n=1 Tax=Celeribacter sp. TaxID=1890673 RepID=UPI003A8E9BC9